jgi:YD repeat-containing protein
VITYAYDGLQRLVGANESPGSSYAYAYDDAGNRTGVWLNGTRTVSQTFNAANQVVNIHNNRHLRYTGAQSVRGSLSRGAYDSALCPSVPPS